MAKPRKLQKKNPKVVWRGDGIEAVYQLLGNEGDAGVVINSARDAMASAVRYGDGEDTDAFIRALAKIEKMTDPQKAAEAGWNGISRLSDEMEYIAMAAYRTANE